MPFDGPEVRTMFPTPLVTLRLHDAAALNARLVTEIGTRHAAESGLERSNHGGWHSANDLFARKEAAHAELAGELRAMVEAATAKLLPDAQRGTALQFEGWVNVSPTGAMHSPHDHPGAFWSGCYYIALPEPADAADRLSGAIEFLDPRGSIGNAAIVDTPLTRGRYTVRPAEGLCLLWPSYVRHWVYPNGSSGDRITAAFNAWFKRS